MVLFLYYDNTIVDIIATVVLQYHYRYSLHLITLLNTLTS